MQFFIIMLISWCRRPERKSIFDDATLLCRLSDVAELCEDWYL